MELIAIFFGGKKFLLFLCGMKLLTVSLLLVGGSLLLGSCKSEYEERLEQARELKEKMTMVQASNSLLPRQRLVTEIESLQEEINFLAKVSGNEELFLREVFQD